MRPTVLLDCDGILADFVGAALLTLRKESGVSVSREAITTWEVFNSIPEELQQHKKRVYELIASELGCFSIAPYPDAKEGLKELEEVANVVIVTSPFGSSKTWMHERTRWLDTHFGIPHSRIIHASAKHYIKGDIFVDDKTSNVESWAKAHPEGLACLWNMAYNEEDQISSTVWRVRGWKRLMEQVRGWRLKSPR
jgi:5'(3')-deoxyribonucleotidase